jgi:putative membrane protein
MERRDAPFACSNEGEATMSLGWVKWLIGIVALLHLGFLVMEAFLWTTVGRKAFKLDQQFGADFAEKSKTLAANMGLYNGFLAAGLAWSLWPSNPHAVPFAVFFLGCVVVAGIVGAATLKKMSILVVQALPAAAALLAIILR